MGGVVPDPADPAAALRWLHYISQQAARQGLGLGLGSSRGGGAGSGRGERRRWRRWTGGLRPSRGAGLGLGAPGLPGSSRHR